MARGQIAEIVFKDNGDLASGASMNVYEARTTTPVAAVFTAETGAPTNSNPLTTVNGRADGWLPPGEYDLAVGGAGITTYTRRIVVLDGGNTLLLASTVTEALLGSGAVTVTKLGDSAVTTAKINDGAVSTAKVAAGAVSDAKLASPNNAAYRTIARATGYINSSTVVGKYFLSGTGLAVISGGGTALSYQGEIYLDDADRVVAGLTQKLRVRMQLGPNATAIGTVTVTGGLYPLSSVAGGAGVIIPTLGAVVAGTTVAYVTPAASTKYPTSAASGFSTDVTIPADGPYILGFDTTVNTTAANSIVNVTLELQVRNV